MLNCSDKAPNQTPAGQARRSQEYLDLMSELQELRVALKDVGIKDCFVRAGPRRGTVRLDFPKASQAEEFLHCVGHTLSYNDKEKDSLHHRMALPPCLSRALPDAWKYGVRVHNDGPGELCGDVYYWGADFRLQIIVQFPQSDLPLVIDGLNQTA